MLDRLHLQSVRRGLAAAACVSLCVLTACSGDAEPAQEEHGSSGSAEESAAAEVPAGGEEPTRSGVTIFVGHWITMLAEASNSGETGPWRELAQPDCTACVDFADGIDDLYEGGGSLTSEGWKVLSSRATLRPADASKGEVSGAVVQLEVNRTPEAVYKDAESRAEVFRGGNQRYVVRLVRVDDAWSVRDFTAVKPDPEKTGQRKPDPKKPNG